MLYSSPASALGCSEIVPERVHASCPRRRNAGGGLRVRARLSSRPIRIIVPTPAGGPVDVMARVLANALPAVLGQTVFIENKPGAGNTIGSRQAAAADPDGYTLMVSAASGLIMSPMIVKNAGYDASSFAPVALIAETPQVLVINPQLPFKSVAELVAARENPGKLNYSTGGIGTLPHLNAELFKSVSGVNILHVPYKGGGPSYRRRGGRSAVDLRHGEHVAATDPGWQIAGACNRRLRTRTGCRMCLRCLRSGFLH